MIKKTLRSAVALLLTTLLVYGLCSQSLAATLQSDSRASDNALSYVSLGDEVSAGRGLVGFDDGESTLTYADNSYPKRFAAWLAGSFTDAENDEYDGYNGKVLHTPLAMSGLRSADLSSLLENSANSKFTDCVKSADVISLDLGRNDFAGEMFSEIKNAVSNGDTMGFSSAHSIDALYNESSLPQNIKNMIGTLVDGYGEVIAELAYEFANGDESKAAAADYIITYYVVRFLVNYVQSVDAIIRLNSDVTLIQIALNEECTDSDLVVNGTSIRDFADKLFPSFNGVFASMPSVLITSDSETFKNATFLYAEAETVEFVRSADLALIPTQTTHDAIFNAMRKAYTETYMKTSSSYYVALGDDSVNNRTTYVSLLSSALGFNSATFKNLGQKKHLIDDTISVIEKNASIVSKADIVTVGYSSNIFLKAAGDELNRIMMNQPATEFDWSKLLGSDNGFNITKFLPELEERLISEGLDIDFNGRNLKDMLLSAIEAYAYACVEHELKFPQLLDAIRAKSPDALIVCLGFYNGVENVTIAVDGAEFEISEYVQLVVEFANAQNRYHTSHRDNVIYIDTPDIETVRASTGNTKAFSFTDFIREITSSLGASFLPSSKGCQHIRDLIVSAVSRHTHDYAVIGDDATCTKEGFATYTCSCGDVHSAKLPAKGHSYKEASRKEPTCTEAGSITYICSGCGTSFTDKGDAPTGHSYKESARTEPTCDEAGTITFTCDGCGNSYTISGESAKGHNYKESARTEPTCDEAGTVTFTCDSCGNSYTIPGESAKGHDYKESARTEPTCDEAGTITFTCDGCGNSYTIPGESAKGHDYDIVVTGPDCSGGYTTYTCKVCGYSYVDNIIYAPGHTYEVSDKIDATCTDDGKTTYTCIYCGDSYTDTTTATGHTSGTFCENCGIHLCDGKSSCPSNKFEDLDPAKWYHQSIDFVISTGLMNGQSATAFGPDGETTRAMFVTTLYRLEGSPKVTGSASFSDVESGMWYSDAILWAEQNSIVNGVGAGRFAPNDNVTREQIALMFYRYFNLKGVELNEKNDFAGFTDKDDVSDWARDAMSWAVGSGFITGRSATTLVPRANSNRSELATLLYRASSTFLK